MESVKVVTRVRPPSVLDNERHSKIAVRADSMRQEISVSSATKDSEARSFVYDAVYSPEDTTAAMFDQNMVDLIDGALNGYNCTVFAYGQTGSGKSYTMHGDASKNQEEGIVFRAIDCVFHKINNQPEGYRSLVYCSFLEIYMEEFRDLLKSVKIKTPDGTKSRLALHEGKDKAAYVEGLSSVTVQNQTECRRHLERGLRCRQQASTKMNADSSRSHAIFTITVEVSKRTGSQNEITMAKLNFVDLAGSERQAKAETGKDRQSEAIRINLSLSTLGRVIQALTDGKSQHVPYRDSKLTRLLETSLGGNARTLMISCVSPAEENREESLSTLTYASRAKSIKNKPVINMDPQTALIHQYLEHIRRLEDQIAQSPVNEELKDVEITQIREEMKEAYRRDLLRLEARQAETLRLFELEVKQANQEEKVKLKLEKDEELARIQEELVRKQKDEFKRLEIQRVEEVQALEGKLRKAVDEEKRRIQMESVEEMRRYKDEADRNVATEKAGLEEQQSKDLVAYREKLRTQMEDEQRRSYKEIESRLKADFEIQYRNEKARLETDAEASLLEMEQTLKSETEMEVAQLRLEKTAEIRKLQEEKHEEIRSLLEQLRATQETDLLRLTEQHAELVKRLEKERQCQMKVAQEMYQTKKAEEMHRLELEFQIRKEEAIRKLQQEHEHEIFLLTETITTQNDSEKQAALEAQASRSSARLSQMERKHKADLQTTILKHREELETLKKSHEDKLRYLEQVRCKETQEQIQQIRKSAQRELDNKVRLKEHESAKQSQQMRDQCDKEISVLRASKDKELENLRTSHKREVEEYRHELEKMRYELLTEKNENNLLEKRNAALTDEKSQLEVILEDHVGCKELLEDVQRQKVDIEQEGESLREQLEATSAELLSLHEQLAELQEELDKTKRRAELDRGPPIASKQISDADLYAEEFYRRTSQIVRPRLIPLASATENPMYSKYSSRSSMSPDSPKRASSCKTIVEPRPLTSSRREALIQAVAGINSESLPHSTKERYENRLDDCMQLLQKKDSEVAELESKLVSEHRKSAADIHDLREDFVNQKRLALLFKQILRLLTPRIPPSNYQDLQTVMQEATWDETANRWCLPDFVQKAHKPDIDLDCFKSFSFVHENSHSMQHNKSNPGSRHLCNESGQSDMLMEFDPRARIEFPRPLSSTRTSYRSCSVHRRLT